MNDLRVLEVSFNSDGYWNIPINEEDPDFMRLIQGKECVKLLIKMDMIYVH